MGPDRKPIKQGYVPGDAAFIAWDKKGLLKCRLYRNGCVISLRPRSGGLIDHALYEQPLAGFCEAGRLYMRHYKEHSAVLVYPEETMQEMKVEKAVAVAYMEAYRVLGAALDFMDTYMEMVQLDEPMQPFYPRYAHGGAFNFSGV